MGMTNGHRTFMGTFGKLIFCMSCVYVLLLEVDDFARISCNLFLGLMDVLVSTLLVSVMSQMNI